MTKIYLKPLGQRRKWNLMWKEDVPEYEKAPIDIFAFSVKDDVKKGI